MLAFPLLGALLAWLCLLSVEGIHSIRRIIATSPNIPKGICVHYPYFINGTLTVPGECRTLTCYYHQGQVLIEECQPLEHDCQRVNSSAPFPFCCEKKCLPRTNPYCTAPDGVLIPNGESWTTRNPCMRYTCKDGKLETQRCSRRRRSNKMFLP
uniref:Single domain-containing protein n=1 Tax=Amblyomma maculatum TaxID=34609 RepID=G3MTG6_AMBMU